MYIIILYFKNYLYIFISAWILRNNKYMPLYKLIYDFSDHFKLNVRTFYFLV